MFETVAPDAFAKRDRHVFYETLPASVAIHAAGLAAIAVVAVAHIGFPLQPPKMIVGYIATSLGEPVPPPPPAAALNPPDAKKSVPKLDTPSAVTFAPPDLAPSIIPDAVPDEMPIPSSIRLISSSIEKFAPSAGIQGGVSDGVVTGSRGGSPGGVLGGIVGGDGRVHFERDANLPLFVEDRPYPEYPKKCADNHWEDTVVVKYVIGKDGHVQEISVTQRPYRKEFEASTLAAISRWRFRPLIIDGEAMEVVHELTVYFRLY
jgi:TonB family protein